MSKRKKINVIDISQLWYLFLSAELSAPTCCTMAMKIH